MWTGSTVPPELSSSRSRSMFRRVRVLPRMCIASISAGRVLQSVQSAVIVSSGGASAGGATSVRYGVKVADLDAELLAGSGQNEIDDFSCCGRVAAAVIGIGLGTTTVPPAGYAKSMADPAAFTTSTKREGRRPVVMACPRPSVPVSVGAETGAAAAAHDSAESPLPGSRSSVLEPAPSVGSPLSGSSGTVGQRPMVSWSRPVVRRRR
jgi:hypothetical protein